MGSIKCGMYALMADTIHPSNAPKYLGLALQSFNNKMFDTEKDKARGLRLSPEEYYTHGGFEQWKSDKILMVLNGGTTNSEMNKETKLPIGDLNRFILQLGKFQIETGTYYSPEFGNQLTCVVFLGDERVFNKEKYPDFDQFLLKFQDIIDTFEKDRSYESIVKEITENRSTVYEDWVILIGGKRNEFLRSFLSQFEDYK